MISFSAVNLELALFFYFSSSVRTQSPPERGDARYEVMPLKLLRPNRKQDVENVKINPHNGTRSLHTRTHTSARTHKGRQTVEERRGEENKAFFNSCYYWDISH